MLVMIKEILGDGKERDITINPNEVISVAHENKNGCVVELVNGRTILVKGNIVEITSRLNSNKRSNKNENKTLLQG